MGGPRLALQRRWPAVLNTRQGGEEEPV